MSNYTTVVAFRRFALNRLRRHVLLLTHNLFPGAHFLNFWGLRGRKAGHSCQGFLQNWVIFYSNFKLRILQSWIILYILFRFWSHTVKYNLETMIDITLGEIELPSSHSPISKFFHFTFWYEPTTKILFYIRVYDWFQYFTISCVGSHQPEEQCRRMLQDPQHHMSCIYNC